MQCIHTKDFGCTFQSAKWTSCCFLYVIWSSVWAVCQKDPNLALKPDFKESPRLFKDKILSKNCIPVLFLENTGHTFIMRLDLSLDNIANCHSLELVLAAAPNKDHLGGIPATEIANCIPIVTKLMSTAKAWAILVFVFSSIYSSSKLALTLGMQHQQSQKLRSF